MILIYISVIVIGLMLIVVLLALKKLDLSAAINIGLMLVLVITTIFYAERTGKMAEIMKQTNRLNFRPCIQIVGYTAAMLSRIEKKREDASPIQSYFGPGERSFSIALDPQNNEYLLYSLENIGNVAHAM